MKEVVQEGKTREEALAKALEKLGVSEDQVEIEEVQEHRDRFFGLLSTKITKLKVTVIESPEAMVREFVENVLEKMQMDLQIEIELEEDKINVRLEGEDSGMIIGKFGQTLDSLQYLSNIVLGKSIRDKTKVVIHVGDYRQRRESSLRRMAKAMAYKVIKNKKRIVLAPMPPQDRRIIHMSLSNFRNVTTSSEGVGNDRRVVISYKEK